MPTRALVAFATALLALSGACASAADAPPPARPATAPAPIAAPVADPDALRAGEPAVQRTVIDDGRARIEELRVRGRLQRVTVDPKGRAPGYEILLDDGAHAIGDDPGTSRGSAGKRVWNVLRF
jgi:CubicO group peptidase (beta-lactamase class C family)